MNINWSAAPEGYPIWIEAKEHPFCLNLSGWFKEEEFYVHCTGFKWPKSAEGVHFTAHRHPADAYTDSWFGMDGSYHEDEVSDLNDSNNC